jgi:hypothetical protein
MGSRWRWHEESTGAGARMVNGMEGESPPNCSLSVHICTVEVHSVLPLAVVLQDGEQVRHK